MPVFHKKKMFNKRKVFHKKRGYRPMGNALSHPKGGLLQCTNFPLNSGIYNVTYYDAPIVSDILYNNIGTAGVGLGSRVGQRIFIDYIWIEGYLETTTNAGVPVAPAIPSEIRLILFEAQRGDTSDFASVSCNNAFDPQTNNYCVKKYHDKVYHQNSITGLIKVKIFKKIQQTVNYFDNSPSQSFPTFYLLGVTGEAIAVSDYFAWRTGFIKMKYSSV